MLLQRTLLSFERPLSKAASLCGAGCARVHLENSYDIEITGVLLIKRTRAHDGCLGPRADEGRGRLRKARGDADQSLIPDLRMRNRLVMTRTRV